MAAAGSVTRSGAIPSASPTMSERGGYRRGAPSRSTGHCSTRTARLISLRPRRTAGSHRRTATRRITMANVLITGIGIGIGRATAIAFARAGYAVMATDILNDDGAGLVDEIRNGGGIAEFFHLDVTDTARTNEVVAEVTKRP